MFNLRSPPYIWDRFVPKSDGALDITADRCWKALLLTPEFGRPNEWMAVREHFENSRSKKVLSILQQ